MFKYVMNSAMGGGGGGERRGEEIITQKKHENVPLSTLVIEEVRLILF